MPTPNSNERLGAPFFQLRDGGLDFLGLQLFLPATNLAHWDYAHIDQGGGRGSIRFACVENGYRVDGEDRHRADVERRRYSDIVYGHCADHGEQGADDGKGNHCYFLSSVLVLVKIRGRYGRLKIER